MELKKCPEGHYYDASAFTECPTCRAQKDGAGPGIIPAPPLYDDETIGDPGPTAAVGGRGGNDPTKAPTAEMGTTESSVTMPSWHINEEGKRYDPVVGWLVAVNGSEKGRDYQIHSDNNYIGKSEKMDICIRGNDDTISRERHAVITYDGREKAYYFAPSGGRSIVRVNGKAVLSMVQLSAYDTIEIGRTKLIFVPLCGEKFDWENA